MFCSPPVSRLAVAVRCVAAVAVSAVAIADEPFRGELDLRGGRGLPGRLVPLAGDGEPRQTLLWEAPLFARPLEFHLDEIAGMRFTRPRSEPARPAFRVHLRGGDVIEGDLEAIDADVVAIRPPAGWSPAVIRIRRDVVEGLSRGDAESPLSLIHI